MKSFLERFLSHIVTGFFSSKEAGLSCLSAKLDGNVPLEDILSLLPEHPLGLVLHHIMFSKMLYILWMNQVLLFRVRIVVFLEMVDFVFIFVVSMMSGSQSEVRKLFAGSDTIQPLVTRD